MNEIALTFIFSFGVITSLFITSLMIKSIFEKLNSEMKESHEMMQGILNQQVKELLTSNDFTKNRLDSNDELINQLNSTIKEVDRYISILNVEISNLGVLVMNREVLENEIIKLKRIIKRKEKQ
ncbi:hypothetical protein [Poseidonibacter ostreae]|uniref:Uncharacterized protein n=1 Tax=Poseidonibacter ostreae TaxID=2654171 RepID=A0A6L4WTK3_9BACT|nr:hypothetical protein [Poseidonibacter ostreae]KAB7888876.1 hypothetical protein GBG18_12230 [Poseidonibacter ostreae]KAB7889633.1 hypothetical protein GBG19_05340 [Poseidonibacter ostreae]